MDSEMLYIKGSYNLIEKNYFENGAGSLSDGVVTLKIAETNENIVRNNKFVQTSNDCTFIRLGGKGHSVINNTIESRCSPSIQDTILKYAIYFSAQGGDVSRVISNKLSFPSKSKYMAIYANGRGALVVHNNIINNPYKLLKNNKRKGNCMIKRNTVFVDAQRINKKESFIEISDSKKHEAIIEHNNFIFTNSQIGYMVKGSNYSFIENDIEINNTSFTNLLSGVNTKILVYRNVFNIKGKSHFDEASIIKKNASTRIFIKENIFR